MINSAKECLLICFLLVLIIFCSLVVLPISLLGVLFYILLAIIKWDIRYIDEEL
jgi:hypothetical protein